MLFGIAQWSQALRKVSMALALLSGAAMAQLAELPELADVADAEVRTLAASLFNMGMKDAALRVIANYRATPRTDGQPPSQPQAQPNNASARQPPVSGASIAVPVRPIRWEAAELRSVELLEDSGARIQVRKFDINRTRLIPADELQSLLSNLVGKELDFAQLKKAALRLTEHYRSKGYKARAVLPAQSLDYGLVKIVVLESQPPAPPTPPVPSPVEIPPALPAPSVPEAAPTSVQDPSEKP